MAIHSNENIDERITEVVECIRNYRDEAEELNARIQELKAELRDLLEKRGESWNDASGYARLVAAGERISYNVDELDELIIGDPLRYGWLKDYRVISTIQGRVQVK